MPLPKKSVLRQRENIRKAREALLKEKSGKNASKPSCSTATSTHTQATSTPSSAQKRKRLSKEGEKPKETVSDEYILVKKSDRENMQGWSV